MSGDVQPRKRKDKRRKKADGEYTIQRIRGANFDEEDNGTPPPTLVNPSENGENLAIHIHKESSTGGHWCARIIFFTLSAVLIGLIGIIIFEYRGATDVDTPIASSQWAMIFDGWVDDVSIFPNDEHATDQEVQSGEHEEDEDEKSEEDEDHDEGLGDEKDSQEEEEEEDEEGEGEDSEHEEETDKDAAESAEEDDVDYEEGREKESSNSPEEGEMLDDSEENQELDNDEGYEEEDFEETDELGVLEEVENMSGEENNNAMEEDNILNEPETEQDDSLEGVKASEEKFNDETASEFVAIPGVNEIDDNNDEPLEEIDEEEPEDIVNDFDEGEEKEEEEEEESSSVAVKFGVGVALVIAAHFVLVRRWNNGDADIPENLIGIEDLPDLCRRNTIVPPPHTKQISTKQSTQESPSKKQTRNYEELLSKYKSLGSDEALDKMVVKKFSDLQAEKLIKLNEDSNIQTEAKSASEEEDYVETSEGEQVTDSEEIEDEEEEEDEDEDEDEEDEEIEDIKDTELVAKLEAKYGKLPIPTESEGDDDDEEEDEDEDDEEEEEDDIKGWKHVKAPAGVTQKTQIGLNRKLNSSTAVPKTSNLANVSTSADLITSEELKNPHLKGPDN